MLRICCVYVAGQTAEPIGLKFVVDTNGWAFALKAKKWKILLSNLKKDFHWPCRARQLVRLYFVYVVCWFLF